MGLRTVRRHGRHREQRLKDSRHSVREGLKQLVENIISISISVEGLKSLDGVQLDGNRD